MVADQRTEGIGVQTGTTTGRNQGNQQATLCRTEGKRYDLGSNGGFGQQDQCPSRTDQGNESAIQPAQPTDQCQYSEHQQAQGRSKSAQGGLCRIDPENLPEQITE